MTGDDSATGRGGHVRTLRVVGSGVSINVRKVLWTCDELGIDYVHDQSMPTSSAAFRQLNPNGLMPVIQVGTFVLWESNTICRFLVRKHARDDLLPVDPMRAAVVEQWMDWCATTANTAWRYSFMALVRKHPDFNDDGEIHRSIQSWNAVMTVLDGQLGKTEAFVTGPRFTLADVTVGLAIQRWRATPMERPHLPAIDRYFARLRERRAFRTHCDNGLP